MFLAFIIGGNRFCLICYCCFQKFNEAELKFRLHRCLLKQGKREEAMGVLGSIPEEEMTPKVSAFFFDCLVFLTCKT